MPPKKTKKPKKKVVVEFDEDSPQSSPKSSPRENIKEVVEPAEEVAAPVTTTTTTETEQAEQQHSVKFEDNVKEEPVTQPVVQEVVPPVEPEVVVREEEPAVKPEPTVEKAREDKSDLTNALNTITELRHELEQLKLHQEKSASVVPAQDNSAESLEKLRKELTGTHAMEIAQLKQAHSNEVAQLKQAHEKTVSELNAKVQSLQNANKDEVKKLKEKVQQEQGLSFGYKQDLTALEKKYNELQATYLQVKHDNDRMKAVNESSKTVSSDEYNMVKRMKDDLEKEVAEMRTYMSERKVEHEKQVESVREQVVKLESDMAVLKQEIRLSEQKLKKTMDESEQQRQAADQFKHEITEIKKKHEVELQEARNVQTALQRKFYHHAFLAVKLKLMKNFSVPDLIDSAMREQVDEKNLNQWIAKKLGLNEKEL